MNSGEYNQNRKINIRKPMHEIIKITYMTSTERRLIVRGNNFQIEIWKVINDPTFY
jgi:hypothetical protein